MAENKKPVKVIKAGDMSPETKALPDQVVKPPKGIGSSEKDMSPLPKKDTSAPTKKAAPKPDYEGEMGYSPEEMAEVEQARKRLAKQGIYKKGGMVKSSASKRADGIAIKGKTRGKIC
jgi:hypothetical protein